jgi:raffinose/stachyose/melibiose transport system permease protein
MFFAVFMVIPVLAVIGLAFSSWTGFNLHDITFNGLGNFRKLPDDTIFVHALLHTAAFVAVTTVALNAFGLSLAILINSRVRGHDFLRIAMFVPLGLSPVITGVIWQQLLGPYGLVNSALDSLGFASHPVQFLGDPSLAFWTVIAASIWQYSGYNMLLYYAGLQSLPQERLEAAAIDGAGPIARFRHIVVPYLRPVIAVVVVLNLIGGWKVFDLVYVLTSGGPNHSTEVLSTYLYQQAFTISANGYASAIALVIVVLATFSALLRGRIHGDPT